MIPILQMKILKFRGLNNLHEDTEVLRNGALNQASRGLFKEWAWWKGLGLPGSGMAPPERMIFWKQHWELNSLMWTWNPHRERDPKGCLSQSPYKGAKHWTWGGQTWGNQGTQPWGFLMSPCGKGDPIYWRIDWRAEMFLLMVLASSNSHQPLH